MGGGGGRRRWGRGWIGFNLHKHHVAWKLEDAAFSDRKKQLLVLTDKQVVRNNYKDRDGQEKSKGPAGGNQEEADNVITLSSHGRKSSVPSICGKQYMHRAQILQREKLLSKPSIGEVSRHVVRQLKRSQCLFSPLRLLPHHLLCFNFLFEGLHLLVFSFCVPMYSDILHSAVLHQENAGEESCAKPRFSSAASRGAGPRLTPSLWLSQPKRVTFSMKA